MNIKLKLADVPIEIETLYDCLHNTKLFEIDDVDCAFKISTNLEDIYKEQAFSIKEAQYEGIKYHNYSFKELENTAVYRKIAEQMPSYNGFVFHGSAVSLNSEAYIFTAKSRTGKTTHTRLWLKNIQGSEVVNGDKPIIRIINDIPCVCGTPWMGKERYGNNKIVPIKAICFIKQGKDNSIKKINFNDAFQGLLSQTYRPDNGQQYVKTIKLIEQISKSISFYELTCNMEDDAAILSYNAMK